MKLNLSNIHEFEVIPLGTSCINSHYLNQKKIRKFSYPFDWNVTPLISSINLIENNFTDFLKYENLIFMDPSKRYLFEESDLSLKMLNTEITPVMCTKYKILFAHDFPVNYKDFYQIVFDKYQRRIERLKNVLESGKTIFFIYDETPINNWQNKQYLDALSDNFNIGSNWKDCLRVVMRNKYPSLQYDILSLNEFKKLTQM